MHDAPCRLWHLLVVLLSGRTAIYVVIVESSGTAVGAVTAAVAVAVVVDWQLSFDYI